MIKLKNDWSELGLKGKVKSLHSIRYEAIEINGEIKKEILSENGVLQKKEHSVFFNERGFKTQERDNSKGNKIYTYDENGNKIYEEWGWGGDSSKDSIAYEYNDKGDLIYISITTYGNKISTTKKYDERGNLISATTKYSDERRDSYEYSYDDMGNKIKEEWESSDYSFDRYCIYYDYDKKGNKVKEQLAIEGLNSIVTTFEYSEHGNKIKELQYEENGFNGVCIYQHNFNEKGNLTEENYYSHKNNTHIEKGLLGKKTAYEYDGNANLISKIYYNIEDGFEIIFDHLVTYIYDNKQNKISEIKSDVNNKIVDRFDYKYDYMGNMIDGLVDNEPIKLEYDNYGNWIKKTEYLSKKPRHIIERKIEYYEKVNTNN